MTVSPGKRLAVNRRRFLQGSAGLGAAGLVAPRIAWAQDGGRLIGRTYTTIDSFDPAFYTGLPEEEIGHLIYEKLIHYTAGREWTTHHQAALSMEQLDPTRIGFELKPGIRWSNGFGELTAADVQFSYERMVDPEVDSPLRPDWGSLSGVEVTGDRTGIIHFAEPFAPVWNITLPYIGGTIICKRAWEEMGGRVDDIPPTVSGPYQVVEWSPGEATILRPNPDYSGEDTAQFEEIRVVVIDDENTAEIAYEAGDIDFTRVSLTSLGPLKENPPASSVIEEFPSLYYVWVGMNLENPKFADIRVRQAIQRAIDVPSILEAAYFGQVAPSTGIIAPGLLGHRERSLVPPEADFEAAQRLMDEAGVTSLDVTLDVLNKAEWVTAAQVIQATLSMIGINVTINQNESGAFWTLGDESQGDRWQQVELILNRFSMTPDPYYATSWFITEQVGIWNWERFRNEEFDRLHVAAAAETDPAERGRMYQRMQDLMEESGAYRFITHEATPVIFRDTLAAATRPDGIPLYRYFRPA